MPSASHDNFQPILSCKFHCGHDVFLVLDSDNTVWRPFRNKTVPQIAVEEFEEICIALLDGAAFADGLKGGNIHK